jgi:hypothetical protein
LTIRKITMRTASSFEKVASELAPKRFKKEFIHLQEQDRQVRGFTEAAFDLAEESLSCSTPILVFVRTIRSHRPLARLEKLLSSIRRYAEARYKESGREIRRAADRMVECEAFEPISRVALGNFLSFTSDGKIDFEGTDGGDAKGNRGSAAQEAKMLGSVAETAMRRFVVQWGLFRAYEIGFACALLGRDTMPPFEQDPGRERQKNRNYRKRQQVLEKYKRLKDHPLKEKVERIRADAEQGENISPAVWQNLLESEYNRFQKNLQQRRGDQLADWTERYAQLLESDLESDRNEFKKELNRLLRGAEDRGQATGLSAAIDLSLTGEEEKKYRDVWKETDLGAKWWLRGESMNLEAFRSELREEQAERELRLMAWEKVRRSYRRKGDPRAGLTKIAAETARQVTPKQIESIRILRQALRRRPGLRKSKKEEWARQVDELLSTGAIGNENNKSFSTCRRNVDRAAHRCFETDQKTEWIDAYRRFESGGFAQLIEDLFDGSWKEKIGR